MKFVASIFIITLIPSAAFRFTGSGLEEEKRNLKARGGYYASSKKGEKGGNGGKKGYYAKSEGGKKGYYAKSEGGKKGGYKGDYYDKSKGGKKGGYGDYYFKSKGKGDSSSDCSDVVFLAKSEEIVKTETSVGETLQFDIYDATSLEVVGLYEDAATSIKAGGVDNCLFTGALSFDFSEETESYDSQINLAATCDATYNSITGGSGQYSCATGYALATTDNVPDGYVGISLNICGGGCHI